MSAIDYKVFKINHAKFCLDPKTSEMFHSDLCTHMSAGVKVVGSETLDSFWTQKERVNT